MRPLEVDWNKFNSNPSIFQTNSKNNFYPTNSCVGLKFNQDEFEDTLRLLVSNRFEIARIVTEVNFKTRE